MSQSSAPGAARTELPGNDLLHDNKGNTLLSDDELEMLVVLRMNREFMRFMREFYSNEAKQEFGQTVVRDV